MNHHLLNQLRVSGPLPHPVEIEASRRALQEGLDLLAREGLRAPSLKAVIWRLAQDAAETLRLLPDRERAWLLSCGRSMWPEHARPSEECRRIEWEIAMEGLAGVREPSETPTMSRITDHSAVDRCMVVLSWLRFVRGRNRARVRRDQRMFIDMARGFPPQRIKVIYSDQLPRRCSDSTIQAVKGKVLLHLTLGLMPYSKRLTFNGCSRNLL